MCACATMYTCDCMGVLCVCVLSLPICAYEKGPLHVISIVQVFECSSGGVVHYLLGQLVQRVLNSVGEAMFPHVPP